MNSGETEPGRWQIDFAAVTAIRFPMPTTKLSKVRHPVASRRVGRVGGSTERSWSVGEACFASAGASLGAD